MERQAQLERQAEEQRQAELRREAEARQQEADRIAARQREIEAKAVALEEAEKQANRVATASPLGVGAAAPANSQPAPVASNSTQTREESPPPVQQQKPAPTNTAGATTFRLPEADATTSGTAQQQAPVVAQSAQRPAPQQLPPVQASIPANTAVRTAGGQTEPEIVAVSKLTRTNYVGPEYPRGARRRNITGAVEVQFTVTTDGRVRSMSILNSEPGDTFDQAAMDAVEQWRFEPVIENGVAVEKRTAVRLSFDLQ